LCALLSHSRIRGAAARAIATRWLVLHESGTFVKFTQAGADLSHDPIPIGGTGYR
jgi:hypothetical protein